MIKHIVMFKLKSNFSFSEREKYIDIVIDELKTLPSKIEEIKYFEIGKNINTSARAYDFVLVSEFESADDLGKYANHPSHIDFIEFFSVYRENSIVVDYKI